MNIPVEKFGKDHWSLLAYLETVAVENQPIDERRMRCNPQNHPQHSVNSHLPSDYGNWKYGSYIKGNEVADGHDDWDCKEDLIAAGFLEETLDLAAKLTPTGKNAVAAIREHKQNGGRFRDFVYGR